MPLPGHMHTEFQELCPGLHTVKVGLVPHSIHGSKGTVTTTENVFGNSSQQSEQALSRHGLLCSLVSSLGMTLLDAWHQCVEVIYQVQLLLMSSYRNAGIMQTLAMTNKERLLEQIMPSVHTRTGSLSIACEQAKIRLSIVVSTKGSATLECGCWSQ